MVRNLRNAEDESLDGQLGPPEDLSNSSKMKEIRHLFPWFRELLKLLRLLRALTEEHALSCPIVSLNDLYEKKH
ncbi:hypothetical protein GOBAR_AA06480 [Gossypium barbadense]|uniref:Uncharacterized protein n=1 Tax=Gossypium barbadense TaxID=3634 RepID=A0A2P5YER8_GOSBA|nr:hypothetical protein GOBAR_AA06480 [Gossypium barbadense]